MSKFYDFKLVSCVKSNYKCYYEFLEPLVGRQIKRASIITILPYLQLEINPLLYKILNINYFFSYKVGNTCKQATTLESFLIFSHSFSPEFNHFQF